VEKSFDVAAKNLELRAVQHPSKRNLKLVDAFPLLPDLHSFPDAGGYVSIKFTTNPVPPSSTYDVRLESSLLLPNEPSETEKARREQMREDWERDPERNPPPDQTQEYEFFMAETASAAQNFKRKFDTLDPENDDEELYSNNDGVSGCFRYKRIRAYESQVFSGSVAGKYDDEVVIAIHDGKDGLRSKGAYYYPLVQKIAIRPQRQKNIDLKKNRFAASQDDPSKTQTDFVDLRIEEPTEATQMDRDVWVTHPFGKDEEEEEEEGSGNHSSPEPSGA
jgi:RNA polymerase II-associated factor 1